jgi:hypothetical protein
VEPDEAYWRRPSDGGSVPPPGSPTASGQPPTAPGQPEYPGLRYPGPPVTVPPPSGWRPEQVVEPPPPGRLPAQDHGAIDDQEAKARTLTRGLGLLVGAILLILLCALCGRVLF